jgi:hypothetical protein
MNGFVKTFYAIYSWWLRCVRLIKLQSQSNRSCQLVDVPSALFMTTNLFVVGKLACLVGGNSHRQCIKQM